MTPSGQFTGAWAAHQLADFLSAIAKCADEQIALSVAAERAAEAFDAEVAAILHGDVVLRFIGVADPERHVEALRAAAVTGSTRLEVPGVGTCSVAAHDHDGTALLLVARHDEDPFTPEERALLQSLSRVLTLTLKNFRLLDSLRERQNLLERLSTIQRSISHRANLDDILDAITRGLSELFDDEISMIRLVDVNDSTKHVLASSHGLPATVTDAIRVLPISAGPGGRAIREAGLVVSREFATSSDRVSALAEFGVTTMMATPVHENGRIVGAVLVGSRDPARIYSASEQEMLLAFAEHASLALTDAEALAGMLRSLHDPLTGLPNRTLFTQRLDAALATTNARGRSAVLFIDLDRFKAINDNLGHGAGDRVLIAVAERITATVRPTDLVARLGGDEFTVLIEDARSESDAEALAERIKVALGQPLQVDGRQIVISASIGIAFNHPDRPLDTELVHAADVAMYHAKASGPGQSQTFVPALGERARRKLDIETSLRTALDRGGLMLKYQPLIDLRPDGGVRAVEALLRWDVLPGSVDLSVAETIEIAENTGLIHPLGAWVVGEACREAAVWRRAGIPLPMIHVNVSGHQLRDQAIVEAVATALARNDVPAARLTLEITESVLIGNDARSLGVLRDLRTLGVQLSLDDFGKGYSSLAYLAELDIQSLKIDQRFVQRLGSRSADVVVQHLTAMAQQLGMTVVGEGVETTPQMHRLRAIGCDLAQGYLFAPAIAADEIADMLTGGGLSPAALVVSSAM